MENIQIFKIVLIGDTGVGKSSMMRRYFDNQFSVNFYATVGVDYRSTEITIKNKIAKIQVWDTAGQERFRNITSSYYRNANCFIMVFDITNRNSFNNLNYWYGEIQKNKSLDPLIILIGTKKDLKDERHVYIEDIKKFYEEKDIKYFEISSKENEGIYFIFDYITDIMFEKFPNGNENNGEKKYVVIEKKHNINDRNNNNEKKNRSCCFY